MSPIELRSRREALGLSQAEGAALLGVKQNTISRWESGERPVPDRLGAELADVEDMVQTLVDNAVEAVEALDDGTDVVLWVHAEDASLWARIPELDGLPAKLHRVAMARAASELRADDTAVVGIDERR